MKRTDKEALSFHLPRTFSESIYNRLKEAIINNKLKANQKIDEKELAEIFNVSRTPVREAVLKLGAEGFVKIDAHRRVIVREISYEELKDILQTLGALDSVAVSLAVDNLKPEDIKKLEKITARMEKKCRINSIEKYLELNIAFHNEVWKALPNKFLQELLYYVRDQMLRYTYARIYAFRKPGALERSMKQHKKLLEAIKRRNKEELKELIVKHRGSLLESSRYSEGLREYLTKEERR